MNQRKLAAASSRTNDENAKRVLRALEEARHGRVNTNDPIMEQLKQCPEASKLGKFSARRSTRSSTLKTEPNSETDTYRQRAR